MKVICLLPVCITLIRESFQKRNLWCLVCFRWCINCCYIENDLISLFAHQDDVKRASICLILLYTQLIVVENSYKLTAKQQYRSFITCPLCWEFNDNGRNPHTKDSFVTVPILYFITSSQPKMCERHQTAKNVRTGLPRFSLHGYHIKPP